MGAAVGSLGCVAIWRGGRPLCRVWKPAQKCFRLISGTTAPAYTDAGVGKCLTSAGQGPPNTYLAGVSEGDCRSSCSGSTACGGYSWSDDNNCLLWNAPALEGGGAAWGGAHCNMKGLPLITSCSAVYWCQAFS